MRACALGDMNFDGAINVNDLLDFLLVYDTLCPELELQCLPVGPQAVNRS